MSPAPTSASPPAPGPPPDDPRRPARPTRRVPVRHERCGAIRGGSDGAAARNDWVMLDRKGVSAAATTLGAGRGVGLPAQPAECSGLVHCPPHPAESVTSASRTNGRVGRHAVPRGTREGGRLSIRGHGPPGRGCCVPRGTLSARRWPTSGLPPAPGLPLLPTPSGPDARSPASPARGSLPAASRQRPVQRELDDARPRRPCRVPTLAPDRWLTTPPLPASTTSSLRCTSRIRPSPSRGCRTRQ